MLRGDVCGREIVVDTTGDPYGDEFWRRFFSGRFEPATQGHLRAALGPGVTFLDIGAATGTMTLLAASLGADVYSYEPSPVHFALLERNVALNTGQLPGSVVLQNAAVSNMDGWVDFAVGVENTILSPIVFTGLEDGQSRIPVIDLSSELARIPSEKLFLKIDIEGAEYRLLSDPAVVQSLAQRDATVLLAIHPGFCRLTPSDYGRRRSLFARSKWRLGCLRDDLRLFAAIRELRPSLVASGNRVRRYSGPILSQLGVHEYLLTSNS